MESQPSHQRSFSKPISSQQRRNFARVKRRQKLTPKILQVGYVRCHTNPRWLTLVSISQTESSSEFPSTLLRKGGGGGGSAE